jgi:lipopolysaccharide heptosyltransferase I
MRVLIVRLSSMGDVVHTLPALSDAARANPLIRFDWAIGEAFAQIPSWHRNVEKVFPVDLRRWRGQLFSSSGRSELRASLSALRKESYDFIVDLQGEFKSAFVALLAKGRRLGYDGASAREWGAHFSYHREIPVPKGTHSMSRMRQLLSDALSYSYDQSSVDYGIDRGQLIRNPLHIRQPYLVFIHSTSWAAKNWPEHYWKELAERVLPMGFTVVLPWGSEAERERSERIAGNHRDIIVLPPLTISEKASIIDHASATVGLDTGLSHIAAALGVPSLTLYGATDPNLCGTIGPDQIHIASDFECVKCHQSECSFAGAKFKPACFENLSPDHVCKQLEMLMAKTAARSRNLFQLA